MEIRGPFWLPKWLLFGHFSGWSDLYSRFTTPGKVVRSLTNWFIKYVYDDFKKNAYRQVQFFFMVISFRNINYTNISQLQLYLWRRCYFISLFLVEVSGNTGRNILSHSLKWHLIDEYQGCIKSLNNHAPHDQ